MPTAARPRPRRTSHLYIGKEDQDAYGGQLLNHELQDLRVVGANHARNQTVVVHHHQRQLQQDIGMRHTIDDCRTQTEQVAVENVSGFDLIQLTGACGIGHVSRKYPRHALLRTPKYGDSTTKLQTVIFKAVGDGQPYPDHDLYNPRDWSSINSRMIRLGELITTKCTLNLNALLSENSTFYGNIFTHVLSWHSALYLEDKLHCAFRAALQKRPFLNARMLLL